MRFMLPLAQVSELTYESPVSVQVEPSSISTYTLPLSPSELIAPVKLELSLR